MAAAKPAAWDQGTDPWYCWACSNTGVGVEIDEFGTTDEDGCECCGEFGKSHEFDAEIPPCYPKKIRDDWYATHEKAEQHGYVIWYPKGAVS